MTDIMKKNRRERQEHTRNLFLGLGFISLSLILLFFILILKK